MRYISTSRRSPRRGAVLVHVVLCITVLLGVMAVVLDGGLLMAERRRAQGVADAAALAAAADLFEYYQTNNGVDSGSAVTSANTVATANGYTNSNSTIIVRVNPGNYLGGPNAGTQVPAGYAEVTVAYNQARFFSSIWGSDNIPISARAVARGQWVAASPAILTLAPTGPGTIVADGNGTIRVTGGGAIIDDSSSPSGINTNGSNSLVSDPGGILVSGSGVSGNVTGPLSVNQPPMPDPFRFLPAPAKPGTPQNPTTDPNTGVTTYYPGDYTYDPSLKNGQFVLSSGSGPGPGIYYMEAGFSSSGNMSISITGNNVMIFIAGGSLDLAGNASITLTPPTSGIYQGMTIFQPSSNPSNFKITGNGSFNISGTIYAPNATATLGGNGATVAIGSQIVANKVSAAGNGALSVGYNGSSVAKTRILNLVE